MVIYVVDEITGDVIRYGTGKQIVQPGERVVAASDDLDPQAIYFVGDEPRPIADRRNS